MSLHHGISCDLCRKVNFANRRYKCLICQDFDLCATCHDKQFNLSTQTHSMQHPMQLIVPPDDYERIYFAHRRTLQSPMSLTCSLCGRNGFSFEDLLKHANEHHSTSVDAVLCPICFTRQKYLAIHLHQHTQRNVMIKSKPVRLVQPPYSDSNESKPSIVLNNTSLLAKCIDQHSNTNEADQRKPFIHALLIDLLRRGSFD